MSQDEIQPQPPTLSPGAQRIADLAAEKQAEAKHPTLGAYHWLLALVERHGPMAEAIAQGIEAASLRGYLQEQLKTGNVGAPLDKQTALGKAGERAQARGKQAATERDLAAIILVAAGYELALDMAAVSAASAPKQTSQPSENKVGEAAPEGTYKPRATRPTPTLEQYGSDFTRRAQEGKLPPVVGREDEIGVMVETLCRRTKRNPALVGPAGVGKTAIVEGFAQRVVRGEVPDNLKGVRVLAVQPSTLVAGASMVGELEKRMRALLSEASQDGVILFIDEMHSMIGAGGGAGTSDVASLLKPALARGDLACIAATTDDEYRRYIEPDEALERRFQPIRVQELTPEQTLVVLTTLRDELGTLRSVQVPDSVLKWLVDFAGQFLRNRHFPDKAVDLLEQCVAYAITQGKHEIDEATAQTVAQRMVGMPIAFSERIDALRRDLGERGLLREGDIDALVNRLDVTMRGLDLRSTHPNAVVLLLGDAAEASGRLAEAIAGALFGAEDRVVTLDMGRFGQPHDVAMLIGAPPGYIGYSDNLPLHRVAQMPWCVLRCENVDAAHPQVLEVLIGALSEGFLTEARGKRIYLSDTVVLLTAGLEADKHGKLGFKRGDASTQEGARELAERALGEEFASAIDLVCSQVATSDATRRRWLEKGLLADLSERYRKQGLDLHWDESLIGWLLERQSDNANQRDWERLVDERLSPLLIRHLSPSIQKEVKSLLIKRQGDEIIVTRNT